MVRSFRGDHRNSDRGFGFALPGPRRRKDFAHRRHSQLLSLLLFFWAATAQAQGELKGEKPLLHPIVLIHGATYKGSQLVIGPMNFGEYFRDVKAMLEETGTPVKVVELTTDASIGERAAVLKNYLDTDLQGQEVNLIAHSLGGLDARYAISIMHAKQIRSLTTIGTPHLGTPLADWGVRQAKEHSLWYWFFRLLGYDISLRRFFPEVTTSGMKLFNEKVPDSPEVKYFSVRTRASFTNSTMSWALWFPQRWLLGEENSINENGSDGIVPYDSQKWGKEIAALELDHLGQMNHHEFRKSMEEDSRKMYAAIYRQLLLEGL